MIKIGIVKTVNKEKRTARVLFPDTGLISAELRIVNQGSSDGGNSWLPAIEDEVLCAFTNQKVGFIIGTLYSD